MRKGRLEFLNSQFDNLGTSLENVEEQIKALKDESENEKEMRYLARLLYAGKIIEKVGLLYSFNEQSLAQILSENKSKLEKKNGELVELRDFRKRIGRQRKRNLRRDREIAE